MPVMKILHVLDHSIPLHSGYTFRTCSILREQAKLGWETTHVTSIKHINPQADEETHENLKFYRTEGKSKLLSRIPIINQLYVIRSLQKRVIDVIKREKPDIIHAHSPCLNGIAALLAAKKFSIPVVYEMRASWEDAAVEHGTTKEGSFRYRLTRALETYVFKRVHGITTICNGLKNDITSRSIGQTPIQVIPNAVNAEEFEGESRVEEDLHKKYNLGNSYVAGFIGSFYAYEGLEMFVKALHAMRDSDLNVKGLLVGGGPEDKKLRDLVDELGMQDRIIFTGRVPHSDVEAYYDLIDVLVYPRKPARLTDIVTPLKPLEAMAMGKVFIASNVGGHIELVPERLHTVLFEAGSVDALVDSLQKTIANKPLKALFSGWARKYVKAERNWRKSVFGYVDLYEKAQARHAAFAKV
jgi:PEP-CTERM/exosortase A-associated glycosyltransferase